MSNFISLDLSYLRAINCSLKDVYFSEANLTNAVLICSELEGAIFHNTNLTNSDFRNAINYTIDFKSNTITKAKFNLPEAISLLSGLNDW